MDGYADLVNRAFVGDVIQSVMMLSLLSTIILFLLTPYLLVSTAFGGIAPPVSPMIRLIGGASRVS